MTRSPPARRDVVVAGGMESMTNAPYLLPKHARRRAARPRERAWTTCSSTGSRTPTSPGRLMGTFAEDCAAEFQFTRAGQDAYALASLTRARAAPGVRRLRRRDRAGDGRRPQGRDAVAEDEQPRKARPEKIPTLKPAFRKDGTVTAANSSSISDGAAALVLMREADARAAGLPIRARIARPRQPRPGAGALSHRAGPRRARSCWPGSAGRVGDVDLWEVNEAFAVVPMAVHGADRRRRTTG